MLGIQELAEGDGCDIAALHIGGIKFAALRTTHTRSAVVAVELGGEFGVEFSRDYAVQYRITVTQRHIQAADIAAFMQIFGVIEIFYDITDFKRRYDYLIRFGFVGLLAVTDFESRLRVDVDNRTVRLMHAGAESILDLGVNQKTVFFPFRFASELKLGVVVDGTLVKHFDHAPA